MLYTTQPGGFYGGGIGNEGAMRPPMMAGNPLQDPRFQIPGGQPWNKTPILPGKETEEFNKRPINLVPQLPRAVLPGSSNLPNAIGNMAGVANSQFYRGPQLGQAGLYFGGVM
jgi:hypothetical protein